MLSRVSSFNIRRKAQLSLRSFATVEKKDEGVIGEDGRHEIWRDQDIYDHDNEPKVSEGQIGDGISWLKLEAARLMASLCCDENFTFSVFIMLNFLKSTNNIISYV